MRSTMKTVLLVCMTWPTLAQNTGGFYYGPSPDNSAGSCTDNKGQRIPEGLLFAPVMDDCQVCTCHQRMPVLCRTMMCPPVKRCLSLRVGNACCQWVCDDWSFSDIGLRLVASAVTAILSLSLLIFLIYRLRQRKLRGRQNHLQAQTVNSESGENDDQWIGDFRASDLVDWTKPFCTATHQRPFPPTYDEAMLSVSTVNTSLPPVTPSTPVAYPLDTYTQCAVPTLGRRVLPACAGQAATTMPSILSRFRRVLNVVPEISSISAVDNSSNVFPGNIDMIRSTYIPELNNCAIQRDGDVSSCYLPGTTCSGFTEGEFSGYNSSLQNFYSIENRTTVDSSPQQSNQE